MTEVLLVIEDGTPHLATGIGAVFPELRVQHIAWSAFSPQTLTVSPGAVVVAVAADDPPRASEFFEWLRTHPVSPAVLAVLPTDCEALFRVASELVDDFLFVPARDEELRRRLDRLLRGPRTNTTRNRLVDEMGLRQLVGSELVFLNEIEKLPRFATFDATVLVTGETGTGKELCARAVHHLSKRRPFPFIAVDCSALPDMLFENELFGHARGAYTDAHLDQKGLIGMAERGTLFLDEVDALSLGAQAKFLRFLQERTFKTLGGDRFTQADVSVVAASNRDLEVAVREKRFRADLFYRLNVLRIHMPPLRERRGDIELLARHFLSSLPSIGGVRKTLSASAVRKLTHYDWPGNIRELCNVIHRAALLADGAHILARDLAIGAPGAEEEPAVQTFRNARRDVIDKFERHYIADLLEKHSGNISRAARVAGQERRAFGRLVKKHGLVADRP